MKIIVRTRRDIIANDVHYTLLPTIHFILIRWITFFFSNEFYTLTCIPIMQIGILDSQYFLLFVLFTQISSKDAIWQDEFCFLNTLREMAEGSTGKHTQQEITKYTQN